MALLRVSFLTPNFDTRSSEHARACLRIAQLALHFHLPAAMFLVKNNLQSAITHNPTMHQPETARNVNVSEEP
jgi:hypothetical protein